MTVSNEETEAFVRERKAAATRDLGTIEPRLQEIASEMGELRTTLYAKFGSNINLDSDPDNLQSHLRK
jgi:hypothetical protein